MTILDTFYIMFKSDAEKAARDMDKVEKSGDGVEKALDGADKSVRRLAAGTATADANAKRLASSFLGLVKTLAAPIVAAFSVKGVWDITTGRAEMVRELDAISTKLNSSISDVDAFQRSIQALGGEGSAALDSLEKVAAKVNEAFSDKDSGARKMFDAWGISFKDAKGEALGATDAMLALATSLEGVSQAEALARIKKLGIQDATTINMLLKGREAVESYMDAQKAMGVVTREQAELANEYAQEVGGLGTRLTSFGNNIMSFFLPGLIEVTGALSGALDWMGKNQRLVEGFFIGVAAAVTTYFTPALIAAAGWLLAATWPFVLMGVAVAALGAAFALAYEDFRAWADGQPSIIGELLGDYENFRETIEAIGEAFSWDNFLKDLAAIKNWFSDAFSIDGFLEDVESIKKAFTDLGQWVKDTFGAAIQGVLDLIAGIPGAIKAALVAIPMALAGGQGIVSGPVPPGADLSDPATAAELIRQGIRIAPGSVSSPAGQAGANFGMGVIMPPGVGSGQSLLDSASNAPQGLAAPRTVSQTSTVHVGTVTVNTQATDADGMARAAKQALQTELRGAASDFDDGVDR